MAVDRLEKIKQKFKRSKYKNTGKDLGRNVTVVERISDGVVGTSGFLLLKHYTLNAEY
jgi:hypothetical protein